MQHSLHFLYQYKQNPETEAFSIDDRGGKTEIAGSFEGFVSFVVRINRHPFAPLCRLKSSRRSHGEAIACNGSCPSGDR